MRFDTNEFEKAFARMTVESATSSAIQAAFDALTMGSEFSAETVVREAAASGVFAIEYKEKTFEGPAMSDDEWAAM